MLFYDLFFFVGWWWSLNFLFVLALLLPLRVLYLYFFSPLLFLVFSFFFFFAVVGATNIPGVCFYSFSSHAQLLHLIFLFLFSLVMAFLIYVTSCSSIPVLVAVG